MLRPDGALEGWGDVEGEGRLPGRIVARPDSVGGAGGGGGRGGGGKRMRKSLEKLSIHSSCIPALSALSESL